MCVFGGLRALLLVFIFFSILFLLQFTFLPVADLWFNLKYIRWLFLLHLNNFCFKHLCFFNLWLHSRLTTKSIKLVDNRMGNWRNRIRHVYRKSNWYIEMPKQCLFIQMFIIGRKSRKSINHIRFIFKHNLKGNFMDFSTERC